MSPPTKLVELSVATLIEERHKGALILDTRPAEQFAALHIAHSVNITLVGRFASWAAILINPAQRLLLVVEDRSAAREAQERLARVGLDGVIGYSVANKEQWRKASIPVGSMSTHPCSAIGSSVCEPIQLVDVRSRAEWLRGHLPGAISLPLHEMQTEPISLDPLKISVVYCHEGYRAATAGSLLLRRNVSRVGILTEGVEGWSARGLPLEK